jgi:hypothetical protein
MADNPVSTVRNRTFIPEKFFITFSNLLPQTVSWGWFTIALPWVQFTVNLVLPFQP